MASVTILHNITPKLLITTYLVFHLFYLSMKSLILGTKCVFKNQDLQRIDHKLKKYE